MNRLLIPFLIFALGLRAASSVIAQDTYAGVDLLYPQLAHPRADAQAAIKNRDYRFLIIDHSAKEVPGLDKHQKLRWIYGTKLVRRPFVFANHSQIFSFNIRARAYAEEYNRTLLQYFLPSSKH
jgi:hypothetical protein